MTHETCFICVSMVSLSVRFTHRPDDYKNTYLVHFSAGDGTDRAITGIFLYSKKLCQAVYMSPRDFHRVILQLRSCSGGCQRKQNDGMFSHTRGRRWLY